MPHEEPVLHTETEQEISRMRRRVFEIGDERTLQYFLNILPGGYRRIGPDEMRELEGELDASYLEDHQRLSQEVDAAVVDAGLDPQLVEALNFARVFGVELHTINPDKYRNFELAFSRYVFPAYELLRRKGLSNIDLLT